MSDRLSHKFVFKKTTTIQQFSFMKIFFHNPSSLPNYATNSKLLLLLDWKWCRCLYIISTMEGGGGCHWIKVVFSTHQLCFLLAKTDGRGQKAFAKHKRKTLYESRWVPPTTYARALHQPLREEEDPFTCRCIVARAHVRVFQPFDPLAPFRNRYHGRLQVTIGYRLRLSLSLILLAHVWIIIMYCAVRFAA